MHGAFAPMPLYVGDLFGADRVVLILPYLEVDVQVHRAGWVDSVIALLITVNARRGKNSLGIGICVGIMGMR